MHRSNRPGESFWSLWLDLLSGKGLEWLATFGRDVDLTVEAHLYFFDRYHRLADHYRRRGRTGKAKHYQAKAEEHYRAGGGQGPPYAAAMAMPRPRRFVFTDAVSRTHFGGPDDAA